MQIGGRIAIVTGAASGIGQAVARELARRQALALALVDSSDQIHDVARGIGEDSGIQVEAFAGDVTNSEFRSRVFTHILGGFGVPRICVPAAGITRDSLAAKINKQTGKAELYPLEQFRAVVEVNLIATIYWALEMVGHIAEDRFARNCGQWNPEEGIQGTIIFVGSVSSQGNKGQIAYAATKAGLEGAASTLMKEAIFHGVRCGVIHPGFTDTPMVRALGEEYIRERILPSTQLRRLIRTQEIADAICFMIANSAVSGSLWADAGWHPSA